MFQIVRCLLDEKNEVVARRPLQPLFELREDAAAMAEFDSSRLWEEYGYDEERNVWWGEGFARPDIPVRGRRGRSNGCCGLHRRRMRHS